MDELLAALPVRLLRFWRRHYVEGEPLAAYAEATGQSQLAARGEYRETIVALVGVVRAWSPARVPSLDVACAS